MSNLVNQSNRTTKKADDAAIKSDYRKWKGELSYNNLVDHLKLCYNTYNDYGGDLSLPREMRNSYYDRAKSVDDILKFIERQAK